MSASNVSFDEFRSKFQLSQDHVDVLEKLQELSIKYNLDAGDLHDNWIAFLMTKNRDLSEEPTVEMLLNMQREVLAKKSSVPAKSQIKDDPDPVLMGDPSGLEDIMNIYNVKTPNTVTSNARTSGTPERSGVSKKSLNTSMSSSLRAELYSPKSATPPRIFKNRKNAGESVLNFGNVDAATWLESGRNYSFELLHPAHAISSHYEYMFEKKYEHAQILNQQIQEMSLKLQQLHKIESLFHVTDPIQEVVSIAGRICCDPEGRANAHTILLEGSRETSAGKRIPLDLSELTDYSLFPGQVVLVDGVNYTGKKFLVKKLYTGVDLPLPFLEPNFSIEVPSMNVMTACGPFLTTDSLMFEPLTELLNICRKEKPHVCILLGPFIDEEHEGIAKMSTETYRQMYVRLRNGIDDLSKQLQCHMILVPSQRDINGFSAFPHPPLPGEPESKFMHLVSNPCVLQVNGVVFGITSTDVVFHLSNAEVHASTTHTNRFKRVIRHLFTQHSFYPLYPPPEETLISYNHADIMQLPIKPHILIVPSQLRYFIMDVDGCCCVNPGTLTKGESGGTYARLNVNMQLHPTPEGSIINNIAAQVIRI